MTVTMTLKNIIASAERSQVRRAGLAKPAEAWEKC
jgi:hypothetical protein